MCADDGAPNFPPTSITCDFCACRSDKTRQNGEIFSNTKTTSFDRARPVEPRHPFFCWPCRIRALCANMSILEAVGVEQNGQPLARGQSALGMLRCDTLLAAAESGQGAPFFEFFDRRRHMSPYTPAGGGAIPSTRGSLGQSTRAVYAAPHNEWKSLNLGQCYGTGTGLAPFVCLGLTIGISSKMLQRVGISNEFVIHPAARGPDRPTLLCFSHLRWDFVFQRPQHLMTRFAKEMPVVIWEEPMERPPRKNYSSRQAKGFPEAESSAAFAEG